MDRAIAGKDDGAAQGDRPVIPSPGIRRAAFVWIGLIWLLAIGLSLAVAFEVALQVRARVNESRAGRISNPGSDPRSFGWLERAYNPFAIQHLHPYYLFFFPFDNRERKAIANEVCSVDADGFRGPGPAAAGGRRLAFLLGGSSAFGHFSSSNATTITGYLNRLQDEYFFVNAGVPSWNSTQELERLALQILDYKPSLVVAYDGANDAELLATYTHDGALSYPAGTPESFDKLTALVDDIRAQSGHAPARQLWGSLFPQTRRFLKRFSPDKPVELEPVPPEFLSAGVSRYLSNLRRMSELSAAEGARFTSIFQPVLLLHNRQVSGPSAVIKPFWQSAATTPRPYEFHDFGRLFDEEFASVPAMVGDRLSDDTIFVDQVHLTDRGNEIVARHMWETVFQGAPHAERHGSSQEGVDHHGT